MPQRDALGVVARGARDDALFLLRVGEHGELVRRAAHLERAGDLQVLGLEEQLAFRRDAVGADDMRFADDAFEHRLRVEYLIE